MIEAEFQRGLFEKLAGVALVYDRAPQVSDAQQYPYITFGPIVVLTRDGDGRRVLGFDISFRLHTWARTSLVVRETQAAIYGRLHGQNMDLEYFPTVFMTRNDTDVRHRPDEVSHGVCEYVSRFTWEPWLFDDNGVLRLQGRLLAGEII